MLLFYCVSLSFSLSPHSFSRSLFPSLSLSYSNSFHLARSQFVCMYISSLSQTAMLKCSMPMPVTCAFITTQQNNSCNVRDAINCIDIYQFWKWDFPGRLPYKWMIIFIANFSAICLLIKIIWCHQSYTMRVTCSSAHLHLI